MAGSVITVEKLYQDRLWVITIVEYSREAVDAWEKTVRTYIHTFGDVPERYLVYDIAAIPNLGFTRYLRERSTALAYDNRDATGRVAIVINLPPTVRSIFELFTRYTGGRIQPRLEVKFFADRQAAIAWVASILPLELKAENHTEKSAAPTE